MEVSQSGGDQEQDKTMEHKHCNQYNKWCPKYKKDTSQMTTILQSLNTYWYMITCSKAQSPLVKPSRHSPLVCK